jgi:PIN domain nuclease of toxin-antitoxin system
VKALLDTHVAIWWWCAPTRLSALAVECLRDPFNEMAFSAASAYEIALKHRSGRLPLPSVLATDLERSVLEEGWRLLPISVRHAELAGGWDAEHRDPFDRLLAAQARLENLELVTADPAFRALAISCVW